jgi:hypothetical protein
VLGLPKMSRDAMSKVVGMLLSLRWCPDARLGHGFIKRTADEFESICEI